MQASNFRFATRIDDVTLELSPNPELVDRPTPVLRRLVAAVESEGATVEGLTLDLLPNRPVLPAGLDRVLLPAADLTRPEQSSPDHLVLLRDGAIHTWVAREDDLSPPAFRLPLRHQDHVRFDVLLITWVEPPAVQYDRQTPRRSQPSAGIANTNGELQDCLDSNPFAFTTRLRRWNEDNYTREPTNAELLSQDSAFWGAGDWKGLLVLHGTALQSHLGLRELDSGTVRTLCDGYKVGNSRNVIALDHKTLDNSVAQNARELLDRLPPNRSIKLDILAISRGSLVARYLAEGHADAYLAARGQTLSVRKVVFVGGPNDGTPSAGQAMAVLSNLSVARCMACRKCFSADNPQRRACDALELAELGTAIGALLAFDGLQGQKDMRVDSALIRRLNRRDPTTGVPLPASLVYHAIAGTYSCNGSKPGCYCNGNAIFGGEPNDLVVPRDSVVKPVLGGDAAFSASTQRFPITGKRLHETGRPHSELFVGAGTTLTGWLTGAL